MLKHAIIFLSIAAQITLLFPQTACSESTCGSPAGGCCYAAEGMDELTPRGIGERAGVEQARSCCSKSEAESSPAPKQSSCGCASLECSGCACVSVEVTQISKPDRRPNLEAELMLSDLGAAAVRLSVPTLLARPESRLSNAWALCSHQERHAILCAWLC